MIFSDRVKAGKMLAEALKKYKSPETVIYALPRGGVVTASEIAKKLRAPLDLIIVRKIGHPYNPEYAICALGENGQLICDEEELASVDPVWLQKEIERQRQRARQQREIYLPGKAPISTRDKTAIIVDDGIATGLTMKVAIKEIKQQEPKKIVVAVPVIPNDIAQAIQRNVNELIALEIPEEFAGSVGSYYNYFPQINDEEVIKLLTPSLARTRKDQPCKAKVRRQT